MSNFRINQSPQNVFDTPDVQQTKKKDLNKQIRAENPGGSSKSEAMNESTNAIGKARGNRKARAAKNETSKEPSKLNHEPLVTFTLPETGGVRGPTDNKKILKIDGTLNRGALKKKHDKAWLKENYKGVLRGGHQGPANTRSLEKQKEIAQAKRDIKFEDFENPSSLISKQFPDFSGHLQKLKENNDPEYGTIINNFISQYKFGRQHGGTPDFVRHVKYEAMLRAEQPETFKNLNQLKESQNPEDVKKYQEYTEKLRNAMKEKILHNQNEGFDNLLEEIKNIGKN